MFNRIHSYNNYLIHVIYFVLCSAVEPMTTMSWQLCKQACYQVGYGSTPSPSLCLAACKTSSNPVVTSQHCPWNVCSYGYIFSWDNSGYVIFKYKF